MLPRLLTPLLTPLLARLRGLSTGARLGVVAVLAACLAGGSFAVAAMSHPAHRPAARPGLAADPSPTPLHPVGERGVRRHRRPAAPVASRSARPASGADQVSIPSLDVAARLVPVGLTSKGALDPPADVREAGWWDGSAPAGATVGQTLVTAHTVHTGGGAFDDLGRLHAGDQVLLTQHGRRVPYVVDDVETLSRARLAQQAQDLFGQDVHPGRLVLVTCTGWTGHDYTSNTVVFAHPAVVPGAA